MSLFKLNDDGDLDRGPNNVGFSRVTGVDEAEVALETRMKLVQKEVRRDKRVGVNFFWAMQPLTPASHVANHMSSVAAGTPGVADVQLRFNFFGERGVFAIDMETQFDQDDQDSRTKRHESFLVQPNAQLGGETNA